MRYWMLTVAILAAASCDYLPGQEAEPAVAADRQLAFVELVEANGCQVDPLSHEYVHAAGFSDAELASIGEALVGAGSAEIQTDGTLVVTTGNCI